MKLTLIGMLSLATVLGCANASNGSAASPSAGDPTQHNITTTTGAKIESRAQVGSRPETGKGVAGAGDRSSVGAGGGDTKPTPTFAVPANPRPEPNPPCKPCE